MLMIKIVFVNQKNKKNLFYAIIVLIGIIRIVKSLLMVWIKYRNAVNVEY